MSRKFTQNPDGCFYSIPEVNALLGGLDTDTLAQLKTDVDNMKTTVDGIGTVVSSAWTAESTSSILANVTEEVTLSKGSWVCMGTTPILSADSVFTLRSTSGETDIGNNYYAQGKDYLPILSIFTVSSDTAKVVLKVARAAEVTYTYLERGGLKFIKIK